jgi:hypothetical protein
MHIFKGGGSFSHICNFKTVLKIIYEALIMLPSIIKNGEIESAFSPLVGFGV